MNDLSAAHVTVRPELAGDKQVIYDLTKRAFAPMPYSDGDEQDLVNRLRDNGAMAISLVAQQEDRIVGQIVFSPAFPDDESAGWYALGPVSVEPKSQNMGVGSQLIRKGIKMLQDRNADGCILIGNPEYYKRFGFEAAPESCPDDQPSEYYQMIVFRNEKPEQVIHFHKLFHAEPD